MKIILCGYNWIGCKVLDILISEGHTVFVYTHEAPAYVNSLIEYCFKKKIPYTTERISDTNLPFVPDIIASIYYRYIISDSVINVVKGKIFNLHPSLLPLYKGCSSITWAMINGEKEIGFTYHYLTTEVDGGNILIQKKINIEEWDTQATLYHRIMFNAADFFLETIKMVDAGNRGVSQVGEGHYYKRGCPFNGEISSEWDEIQIERFIRAMNYPPMPFAKFEGHEVKTLSEFYLKRLK